mmetsp:Transcript_1010/g.1898  ORF Transcript_1010/g.1898 Transcript_1010/m.1898 type:complete len:216 (+) Transcript_1010:482-1129(+)
MVDRYNVGGLSSRVSFGFRGSRGHHSSAFVCWSNNSYRVCALEFGHHFIGHCWRQRRRGKAPPGPLCVAFKGREAVQLATRRGAVCFTGMAGGGHGSRVERSACRGLVPRHRVHLPCCRPRPHARPRRCRQLTPRPRRLEAAVPARSAAVNAGQDGGNAGPRRHGGHRRGHPSRCIIWRRLLRHRIHCLGLRRCRPRLRGRRLAEELLRAQVCPH